MRVLLFYRAVIGDDRQEQPSSPPNAQTALSPPPCLLRQPAKFIAMTAFLPAVAFLLMINHVKFAVPYG